MSKINVKGIEINVVNNQEQDYISLTDMVRGEFGSDHIRNWMRNRNTIEYLGLWENINNTSFKGVEFDRFKNQAGLNSFNLTPKKWVEATGAIGITSKSGKYGGTYAHRDIAFHFALWISPEFNLLLIKEFQNLKDSEAKESNQIWNFRRFLTKTNYKIQTDAIKDVLIPLKNLPKEKEGFIYAEEADLLYVAMYGFTSKQWRENNPDLISKGHNLRDYADTYQLIVLNSLETFNAELIRNNVDIKNRLNFLRKAAIEQLKSIKKSKNIEHNFIDSPNHLNSIHSFEEEKDKMINSALMEEKYIK